ncbi:OmpA family protein [Taklimakanibacter lacteus]|uniref:OmpA family protein n=1 Tax=Taklimakanibacter lacteus TaxID=2268456 RepID=UPI000E6732F4
MKKTVITLAAALALGAPLKALAQEENPNAGLILAQDQQGESDPDQLIKKKKKRQQEQQQGEQAQQPAEEQIEQPVKKRKKKQAEQPEEQLQQPVEEQVEQPVKKRKKKQAEQPEDQTQPPVETQAERPEQPVKKKKKEQAEQPQDQPPPASEQTTQQPQPEQPTAAGVPPEVTQYLSDTRSPKELSDAELTQRVRAGRNLVKTKGLPANIRQELANEFKKARSEAMAREQAKATGQPKQGQQTTEQPKPEQPPAGETTTGKSDQMPAQGEGQPAQPTDQAAEPPPVNPDKQEVQKLDGNKAAPEAEAKAKAYLDDARSAEQLNDDELRDRLDGMRELMAGNQLSRDSERALRRKLRAERDILRNRVSKKVVVEEQKDDAIPGSRERRRGRNDRKWDQWAERDVLRDRRRSDQLEEGELRRRIDVYRVVINDDRYDAEERAYWRGMMDRDRLYLRERLVTDRRDRERYWRDRRDRNDLDIDININLGPDREPPEAAFMDEIDDEELEDYLVAAPRRKVARRYTVEEIEEEPELRTAMPAIEIDNIHFGFNESFVREEEVDKLDRIAEVIEKILAAHPGEVFMIAGHTDAVGSDAYNLKLSRERAQAVKKALTAYYVIPARNLVTAGYGERYLKIPTSEAEEENRRVSLQRVTPLVGEAELGQ